MASRDQQYFETRARLIRERKDPKRAALAETERALAVAKVRSESCAVPTNLPRLASHLGVVAIREKPLAFRGRLVAEAAGLAIEVNAELSAVERRFTISHEIGHVLIEGDTLYGTARSKRAEMLGKLSVEIEATCDRIAREVLVPKEWLRGRLDLEKIDLTKVIACGSEAGAPIGCVVDQVLDGGIWRGRFIVWEEEGGVFRPVCAHPASAEDVLARLGIVESGGQSLLAKARVANGAVEGRERLVTHDGEHEYRMQCVRMGSNGEPSGILSMLIYQ
jgi:hypothetical protein